MKPPIPYGGVRASSRRQFASRSRRSLRKATSMHDAHDATCALDTRVASITKLCSSECLEIVALIATIATVASLAAPVLRRIPIRATQTVHHLIEIDRDIARVAKRYPALLVSTLFRIYYVIATTGGVNSQTSLLSSLQRSVAAGRGGELHIRTRERERERESERC
jgi:hypothetical protein